MNFIEEIQNTDRLIKVVCSNPFDKREKFYKITLRLVLKGVERIFHVEKLTSTQAFHENLTANSLTDWLNGNIVDKYKQVCILSEERTVTYLFSQKGSKRLEKKAANKAKVQDFNRTKNYILREGENIPAFVDLGIFTSDFKIVQSKQDKFKQINRFVELIDDAFKNFDGDEITVLDFGCGKSYLTFFIYYYFVEIKHVAAKIIGYDLKADVVDHCNKVAEKYGYSNLKFVVADVSKDKLSEEKIDMVVSLHACDTATDYALNFAVRKNVKYIFSVPCCQHEINLSIKSGGDLDPLLKYGIIKERVSALLTDSIRAMILEDEGYNVDVLEFVDLEHSPKNIMIRAKKTHAKRTNNRSKITNLLEKYQFNQTLYDLLCKENIIY